MSEWIDVNLPWSFSDHKFSPKPPNIDEEIVKLFSVHYRDVYDANEKQISAMWNRINNVADQMRKENPELEWTELRKKAEDSFKDATDPDAQAFLAYRKIYREQNDYINTHPLWVEWIKKSTDHRIMEKTKSFTGQELNKPGIVIEIEEDGKKELLLIGDVNSNGGVCNDCMGFNNPMVLRYKVVYQTNDQTKS